MQYFVTGATGFIGKRLVKALLARRGTVVHFLVRPGSEGKLDALYDCWGAGRNRAVPVDDEILDTMLNDFGCLRVTKGLLPGMVAQDCISKPVRIATRLGITGWVSRVRSCTRCCPRMAQIGMNTSFRMFPDSSAAKGGKGAKPQLSAEAVALQQLMRGIHF